MELAGAGEQQQQSPDSTQDSTEVSVEQAIQAHHQHSRLFVHRPQQQQLSMAQDQNPYGTTSSQEQHSASFFQQNANLIVQPSVKEEPHGQQHQHQQQQVDPSVYTMEQLGWDTHELMESMSPESADLCKNLSSQLEHFRKDFGPCYAESSNNSHLVLEHSQPQQHSPAAASAKTSTITAGGMTSGSELIGTVSHPDNEMLKAAIASHPHYPELVAAHMNCHKVGAPPEVASQIDEIIQSFKDFQPAVTTSIGVNPELDQFMISYYTMLMKYEKEIKKTFKEAVAFCKKLEQQLQGVTNATVSSVASVESDERNDGYETSDEEDSSAEVEIEVDPMAKDKELKEQLMRKYSGYISSLKNEFLKKKKKGKLPKDSRQQLLNWWSLHYKWPYPSESEKASLAESTGLDQKQINNWFINQRKRHWKPSDDLSVLGGGQQPSQNTVVAEATSGT